MKTISTIILLSFLSLSFAKFCHAQVYVENGDNLWRIAETNRMTLIELLELNPQIENPRIIVPGQFIRTTIEDDPPYEEEMESVYLDQYMILGFNFNVGRSSSTEMILKQAYSEISPRMEF